MTSNILGETKNKLVRSVFARVLFLGFLILILQIPISKVDSLVFERENRRVEAIRSITDTWGGEQIIKGPVLIVPYRTWWIDEQKRRHGSVSYAHFLPEKLHVTGSFSTEMRYRGIFKVPLYKADLQVSGTFRKPDFSSWEIPPEDIVWKGALLVFGMLDAKAIATSIKLDFDGKAYDFGPGKGAANYFQAGIQAHPGNLQNLDGKKEYEFSFPLKINGNSQIWFQPSGIETKVDISSDWPDPSFVGAYLPTMRTVTGKGFSASWSVPHLGRNYTQQWKDTEVSEENVRESLFGVSFFAAVDTYSMSRRSIKYELMFILLTFLAFFFFEVFNQLRIHAVQYLLVGGALCMFYLLTLSLAEHLGFGISYLLATFAVVGMVAGYCSYILKKRSNAGIMAGLLILLYGFLYVLLNLQDYALLVGSVGLCVILALVMYITRSINWYDVHFSAQSKGQNGQN